MVIKSSEILENKGFIAVAHLIPSYGFTEFTLALAPYKGKNKGNKVWKKRLFMEYKKLFITNIPAISAIYFALLQCKYDFYPIERDTLMVDKLCNYIMPECSEYGFFSEIRQNTCEVYPYWPRAAMLETTTFYIDFSQEHFSDFNAYKSSIMSAKNISDIERNQLFWDWITKFPKALKQVLQSNSFGGYLKWENDWIVEQNKKYEKELKKLGIFLCFVRKSSSRLFKIYRSF